MKVNANFKDRPPPCHHPASALPPPYHHPASTLPPPPTLLRELTSTRTHPSLAPPSSRLHFVLLHPPRPFPPRPASPRLRPASPCLRPSHFTSLRCSTKVRNLKVFSVACLDWHFDKRIHFLIDSIGCTRLFFERAHCSLRVRMSPDPMIPPLRVDAKIIHFFNSPAFTTYFSFLKLIRLHDLFSYVYPLNLSTSEDK